MLVARHALLLLLIAPVGLTAACGGQTSSPLAAPASPVAADPQPSRAQPDMTAPPDAPVVSANAIASASATPAHTAPWGSSDPGDDDEHVAKGNMWGDPITLDTPDAGPTSSSGGLGTIGMGQYGTIGHGSGTGQGVGVGSGRLSKHAAKPAIREGAAQISGALPEEVIRRIVRQSFGRFRLCYENGLRKKPDLQGRITTRFVIDASGAVKTTADGGSDLPDDAVVGCVVRVFGNLSFPQPAKGEVTVVYPLMFNPGT